MARQGIQEIPGKGYFIVDFSESYLLQHQPSTAIIMPGWTPAPNASEPIQTETEKQQPARDDQQLCTG